MLTASQPGLGCRWSGHTSGVEAGRSLAVVSPWPSVSLTGLRRPSPLGAVGAIVDSSVPPHEGVHQSPGESASGTAEIRAFSAHHQRAHETFVLWTPTDIRRRRVGPLGYDGRACSPALLGGARIHLDPPDATAIIDCDMGVIGQGRERPVVTTVGCTSGCGSRCVEQREVSSFLCSASG